MPQDDQPTQSAPEAIFQQAFDLLDVGRVAEAVACFDRVIALVPGAAAPYVCRGDALQELRQFNGAVESYDHAIALDAGVPEIYANRGVALHALGEFEAAIASYDQAIALHSGYAEAWSNRGNALRGLGRGDDALMSYARAIALDPNAPETHTNRAGALEELDRPDEAVASYEKAIVLAPDLLDAKQHLLWLHMKYADNPVLIERLAGEVAQGAARRAAAALRVRKTLPDFRIQHDLEQADYLLQHGCGLVGLSEARAALADIHARHGEEISGQSVAVTDQEAAVIAALQEQVLRYPAPALFGSCLNPGNDCQAIEDRYFSGALELVVIDNLLSPAALVELRKFCLVSTIWRREFARQYFGAFSDDGFVSPLHLQIAAELRQKMPRIFGGLALEQLWSFKYTSSMGRGINVHADFARVNLNFWVTPDDANLDPDSGGMVIYDVPAPAAWGFAEYNHSSEKIFEFLKVQGAGSQTIAHRCNRAVLFNSNLFHETDAIRFKPGYENRRINITYLFGKRFKA